ncbi:MAG: hypothetical protein E7182_00630 [Erysipelotrichaceae bacterium]|nr:hypothetical protein [Erysipelotrichaceae bacterium]
MPEIKKAKAKKEKQVKPAATQNKVVSAYDEEGQRRNAAMQKRDKTMRIVAVSLFLATIIAAVTITIIFANI